MRKFLLFLIHTIFAITVFGQQYHIRTFSQESNLPTTTVFSFLQDKYGYLWLATDGTGVYKFDGHKSTIYDKSNILTDNVSRALLQDSKGRIWIGTDKGGLVVFDGYQKQVIPLISDTVSVQALSLCEAFDHSIWVGTANGGLFHITEKKNKFFTKSFNKSNSGISTNFVFDIHEDQYHRLWLALLGGVNILTIQNDSIQSVRQLDADYGDIPDNFILDIEKDKKGNLWFATRQKGAFKIFPPANLSQIAVEPIQSIDPAFPDLVWDVFCDSQGVIWFATDKQGVARFENGKIQYISYENGLPSNQIIQVFEDYEYNIWLSSVDAGLCQILDLNMHFLTEKDGLPDKQISSILPVADSAIFTIENHGLFSYKKGKEKPIKTNSKIHLDNIHALCKGEANVVWLASSVEIGAYKNGIIKKIDTDIQFFKNNRIKCIFYDSRHRLWVGTEDGLAVYENGQFKIYVNKKGAYNNISCIIEDKDFDIWVGTLGGVAEYKNDEITYFDEQDGLANCRVTVLQCDEQNKLWIGTNGGCYVLKQTPKVTIMPILAAQNQISGTINAISLADSTVVFGTTAGFVMAQRNDTKMVKSRCLDKTDCLPGVDVCLNGIVRVSNQTLIASASGLFIISDVFHYLDNISPKMHLSQIDLFYNKVDWQKNTESPIDKWLNIPSKLELAYNKNTISFTFNCKTFNNPEKTLYSYTIDNHWSAWQKDGFVSFQQLEPGNYVFQSRALLPNGQIIEASAYEFTIKSPFWKRIWFIGLCVFVVLLFLWSYIKFREKRLRDERNLLDRLVKEKTQEVTNQKEEIESQRDHIFEQSKQITDSILYAEKIQRIALPDEQLLLNDFAEYFVLFRPKDIVSGDFYWLTENQERCIVAVADCTGHGVPGAFMSMLGMSFLNSIVNEKHVLQPNEILNELRKSIVNALKQDNNKKNQDGMDITLIAFNKKQMRIQFAGANNPLWILRNKQIIELKPDKMPIGIYLKMDSFTVTEFDLQPNDTLYMFSDGYSDQFGGPLGKKFKDKQLKEILIENADLPLSEQKELLFSKIEEWKHYGGSTNEQVDDICVMGLRV